MAGARIQIAPSILSADFTVLRDQVRAAERGGADLFHLDIMDGHFVPNLTFGPVIVRAVRRITQVPLESHLMISDADRYLAEYVKAGSDMVTVHAEACPDVRKTIETIRSLGAKPGIAISPDTPLAAVTEFLPLVDLLLVMTVHPGFAGQKFLEGVVGKIADAAQYKAREHLKYILAVDGGICNETIAKVVHAGAEMLVAASAIFGAQDIEHAVRSLREKACSGRS